MTPQELRSSILQLAIQGKLVEQRPEEGTGEELYRQIQAEKQRLIKEGTIKKEKPLPKITEDEKPFEIPESWMWMRLREIVYNHGQMVPTDTFSYIDIGSIDNLHQRLNTQENLLNPNEAPSRARRIVEKGDILYSTVRPYLHNMCIVDRMFSYPPIASTGFAVMSCHNGIYNKYLFYYLMAPAFDSYANANENSKGVAYPAINDDRLYQAVIAIPPLAEQKRIVVKIEELLPYIDRYEQAWSKLEAFNKRFPADMQKALLQMAIQGKLVEQRPEEGTGEELYHQIKMQYKRLVKMGTIKKEKPLPEIVEDNIPFDIPENWTWVRLGDLLTVISGVSYKRGDVCKSGIRILRGGNIQAMKVLLDDDDVFLPYEYNDTEKQVQIGDIVIVASTGSKAVIGKAGYIDRHLQNTLIGAFLRICRPVYLPTANYLRYLFDSEYYRKHIRDLSQGTNINNVKETYITELVVPLPPLAEQKRIVAKLEELLPLCEKLK